MTKEIEGPKYLERTELIARRIYHQKRINSLTQELAITDQKRIEYKDSINEWINWHSRNIDWINEELRK